mgnify:CR=1 FL=1
MKKVIPIILIVLASYAGQTLELDKAKTVSNNLIKTIKNERFDNFADDYKKGTLNKLWANNRLRTENINCVDIELKLML